MSLVYELRMRNTKLVWAVVLSPVLSAACMPPAAQEPNGRAPVAPSVSAPSRDEHDAPAPAASIKSEAAAAPSTTPAKKSGTCEEGNASACTEKGEALDDSEKPGDAAKARAYFQKACDGHDGRGCEKLFKYAKTDSPRDEGKLGALLITGCDAKNAACCAFVADRYESGNGVPKDHAKAVAARIISCEGSLPMDCAAVQKLANNPAEKAAKEAVDRWKAACAKGDEQACYAAKPR